MRISRYVTDIKIDEKKRMLYSTFSRQFYVYEAKREEEIKSFLENINKGTYTIEEIELFKILLKKNIIVKEEFDERKQLEYLENAARFQEHIYKLTVFATNACNFRCTYCEQPHEVRHLADDVVERILKLVKQKAKKYRKIELAWFGGEPLLEYCKICEVMRAANEICQYENCKFEATITTNGYLLDREKIEELRSLNVKRMQITVDGNKVVHNKQRVHISGVETFDTVFANVKLAVKSGMAVTLRININKNDVEDISEIIDEIPKEYRSLIMIDICNIFQNQEKVSVYQFLKEVIDKGYNYSHRWNRYTACHACMKNAVVIDTDGTVLLCTNGDENEKRLGYLEEDGHVCIENISNYYKLKTISARDNPECQNCIELPYCIASCKYARLRDNTKCMGRSGDGLTLEERALLDYYYDIQKAKLSSEK